VRADVVGRNGRGAEQLHGVAAQGTEQGRVVVWLTHGRFPQAARGRTA
jgi:hypothetical protein